MNQDIPTSSGSACGLESSLAAVELELAALAEALRTHEWQALERHAAQLHAVLSLAVQRFSQAARRGGVPPELRSRLASAGGQLATQRESLARATAALDRAMDLLMPGAAALRHPGPE